MKSKFGILASGILLGATLSGCVAYGEAYIPAAPAPQVEVIGVAPYPEAIWVPGYWGWQRRQREYRWVQGYWKGSGHGREFEHRR